MHCATKNFNKNTRKFEFAVQTQSFLCDKARLEILLNLRHARVFQMSTMVNLGIGFQEPLTHPGVKLDDKMSISSWTPQHGGYLLEDRM